MNTSLRSSSSPRAPHLPRAVARALTFAVAVAALVALLVAALAAPQWVDRPMTLPRLVFAGDVGLGIGHQGFGAGSNAAFCLNLEGAFGITDRIEVGLRTASARRPRSAPRRATSTPALWTEPSGRAPTPGEPRARVRGVLLQTDVGSGNGRLSCPSSAARGRGVVLGVPRAPRRPLARTSTRAPPPIGFYDPSSPGSACRVLLVPDRTPWLGPMAAIRFFNRGYLLRTTRPCSRAGPATSSPTGST